MIVWKRRAASERHKHLRVQGRSAVCRQESVARTHDGRVETSDAAKLAVIEDRDRFMNGRVSEALCRSDCYFLLLLFAVAVLAAPFLSCCCCHYGGCCSAVAAGAGLGLRRCRFVKRMLGHPRPAQRDGKIKSPSPRAYKAESPKPSVPNPYHFRVFPVPALRISEGRAMAANVFGMFMLSSFLHCPWASSAHSLDNKLGALRGCSSSCTSEYYVLATVPSP